LVNDQVSEPLCLRGVHVIGFPLGYFFLSSEYRMVNKTDHTFRSLDIFGV